MDIKETLQTKNVSKGKNTCEYVIIHHTATGQWSIKWVLRQLTTWPVSCHFVVDTNWDIYRIGKLTDILWHWGRSSWRWRTDMNRYSIGIEVIWPLPWFTDEQRKSVREIIQFLKDSLGFPCENILRHRDISPGRKTDIHDSFWNNEFKSFTDYQNSFVNIPIIPMKPSEFKAVYDRELQAYKDKTGKVKPQKFSDLSGDRPATIADVKLLIEIANIRP